VGVAEGTRHGARVTDVAGQPAGVHAGDAGHAVAAQVGGGVLGGPPVRPASGEVADDDAPGERSGALVVLVVGAVVADVGVGERDDLPGVAGVGQHLL